MKKALPVLALMLVAVCAGFYGFRNLPEEPAASAPLPPPDLTVAADAVDLNTAELADLMTLPGIGAILAQRILDYREEHGPFSSVTELLQIEGLGNDRLEAILDRITIGGTYENTGG